MPPLPERGCTCDPAARPLAPSFVGAPGIPEPLSRFDVAEQMRRQGFPLAMPQGWDGKQIPAFLNGSGELRPDGGVVTQRRRPPNSDLPLAPDFFDENQRRSRARLGEFEILSPHRDVRDRQHVSTDPQVPFGEKFQCEHFEPAASPLGAVIDCDEASLWWAVQPEPRDSEEPPQAIAGTDPIPLDPTLRAAAIERIRDDAASMKPPPAPIATSPDGVEQPPSEKSSDDGGCAASPDWTSPPVTPGPAGGDASLPTPSPGGGGPDEDAPLDPVFIPAPWVDPCPCHCVCIPFFWLFPILWTFSGLVLGLRHLLQPDRSNLGVSNAWQPTPVVGPPDGFVDQLILESTVSSPPAYDSPNNVASGSIGLSDAYSPNDDSRVSPPMSQPHWLVAGLSQLGEPALRNALPVPVGPGPGIPGIGSQPLFAVDGSRFEASPGALYAGLAPATSASSFGRIDGRTQDNVPGDRTFNLEA